MSDRHPYSCAGARGMMWSLHDLLWRAKVLAGQPFKDQVERSVVPCRSCDHGGKAKHCTGWQLIIDPGSALVFKHANLDSRLVRAELQAKADYGRPEPAMADDWRSNPAATSTVTLELFAVSDERLLARHHLDLANRGQAGPVWHMQSGGNPAGDGEHADSWLDVPRWPLPPADVVLGAEIVVFNLHPHRWQAMQANGAWLRLVQASEDLVMEHYVQHLRQHFLRRAPNRDSTWLAAQSNRGDWDPRP